MVLICINQNAFAWFDCNWSYRSNVVITENSGSTLTDYQVLLTLNSSSLDSNYTWSSNGQELRVVDSDDTTLIDYYIETWDATAKTAEVWLKVPNLPANSNKTIYLYYENSTAPSQANAPFTFTEPGIKFHTRSTSANPNNTSAAFNFFNAIPDNVAGYGCTFVTDFTGVNNRNQFSPPSRNDNFIAYSETFFEVKPAEVGLWSIRYGGDFGRGGALFVDNTALEEDWNNDLWWAFNWGNSDVLEGSINLGAGYHQLEIIGAEGCCDGGITVQFRKPGGVYQTYSTANVDIVSRKCPTVEPSSNFTTNTHFPPEITIQKTSAVISDPVNNTTLPKRIAGARVRYTITVNNAGSPVDSNSINIKDPVPAMTDLFMANTDFNFQDGTPSSGLSFNYAGATSTSDNIAFSNTAGASYNYIPNLINNTDSNVNSFLISPTGRLGCSNNAPYPSFSFNYDVLIK